MPVKWRPGPPWASWELYPSGPPRDSTMSELNPSQDPASTLPEPARPWPRTGSRPGTDYTIFRSRLDQVTSPRTGESMERVALEFPDWVNVVAVCHDGAVVVITQHRFGVGGSTIEIPGGMVDPGEDPLVAAKRELLEETGFAAETWQSLGYVAPNPALQNNRCHQFLASGAKKVAEPHLDPGEDIGVHRMEPAELKACIAEGQVDHALVITALSRVLDLRQSGLDLPASLR